MNATATLPRRSAAPAAAADTGPLVEGQGRDSLVSRALTARLLGEGRRPSPWLLALIGSWALVLAAALAGGITPI